MTNVTIASTKDTPVNTDAEEAIERLLKSYVEAWHRNDMEHWGALFTEDCDFVGWKGIWWKSRGENVAGHKVIPEFIARQMPNYRAESARISFLAPDVALVHAVWTWPGFVPAPDCFPENRSGILTMVLVRRNDAWLIRASHNSRSE
jgi:uncharacterized protein (TIGR02246 family)